MCIACVRCYVVTGFIYVFNFLIFIRQKANGTNAWSARTNTNKRDKKERQVRRAKKKKGIKEAQRAKTSHPDPGN